MHSLLSRQLKKFFGSAESLPPELSGFIAAVNDSYKSFDSDGEMLHRAMELSSEELTQANSELRAVFHAIPDTILRLEQDGRATALKAIEDTDRSLGVVPGGQRRSVNRIQDFPDQAVAGKFRETLTELLRDGQAKVFEYSTKSGQEESFFEARLVPLLKESAIAIIQETTRRKQAEAEHKRLNEEWITASRRAGMAEVATGVLHNVGNVLNSVNVSAGLVADKLRLSKVPNVAKTAALMLEKNGTLAHFLTEDANGKKLPGYLAKLGEHLVNENTGLLTEMDQLGRNIEHIKEVVAMQQSYAKVSGVYENLPVERLVEDSIAMNYGAFERHGVTVERHYTPGQMARVDKHKVLQILINLLRNAKYALDEVTRPDKVITLVIEPASDGVEVRVGDNGIGIPEENLDRIFGHGFTTRESGHGFGLHSAANAAREMGGDLTVASAGLGCGALFTLRLPAPSSLQS